MRRRCQSCVRQARLFGAHGAESEFVRPTPRQINNEQFTRGLAVVLLFLRPQASIVESRGLA